MKFYIRLFIMSFSFFLWLNSYSQVEKSVHIDRLSATLSVLAHDSLQGREAGTIYEIKARDFIIKKFQEIQLDPLFKNTYIQEFEFQAPADYSNSKFVLKGKALRAGLDFYPINKSALASVKAKIIDVEYGVEGENYNDYENLTNLEGKIFLINIGSPNTHGNQTVNIESRIDLAIEKGAKGIILINTDKGKNPKIAISNIQDRYDVPVIFSYRHSDIKKMLSGNLEAEIEVKIEFNTKKSYNVAGYLDAGKEQSIVLGAHYDHLGMGGPTSRFLKEPAIHNGADDNASGVAAIIEIARYFSENPEAKDQLAFNLIIVAFSAEEKGLYGSMEFANDTNIISSEKIHSMLNFDMVGRLSKNELTIIGSGSAEEWAELIQITKKEELKIKSVESSSGGSDHISFYSKQIPVLFFFTGIHDHYHHPDDDYERLNLEGMADIVNYSIKLIQNMNEFQELSYVKLDIADNRKRTQDYKVTLGIMPDYAGGGKGLKVMSVSSDKPADKAGIIDGDIIIQMGDVKIGDIYDYMESLANFNKGDKIDVIIMRKGKKQTVKVEF